MPDLAGTLKEEIRRLARIEVKKELTPVRKLLAKYRSEIAKLKRHLRSQEKVITELQKRIENLQVEQGETPEPTERKIRFSPRSVKAQRDRLGLSAEDYGKLIGVTAFTIYNWENGKTRPRQEQLEALAAARGLTKTEAAEKLEELE